MKEEPSSALLSPVKPLPFVIYTPLHQHYHHLKPTNIKGKKRCQVKTTFATGNHRNLHTLKCHHLQSSKPTASQIMRMRTTHPHPVLVVSLPPLLGVPQPPQEIVHVTPLPKNQPAPPQPLPPPSKLTFPTVRKHKDFTTDPGLRALALCFISKNPPWRNKLMWKGEKGGKEEAQLIHLLRRRHQHQRQSPPPHHHPSPPPPTRHPDFCSHFYHHVTWFKAFPGSS